MLPSAATEQYDAQVRRANVTTTAFRRIWQRMRGRRWSTAWSDDVGPATSNLIRTAQTAAAAQSAAYAVAVLDELDIDSSTTSLFNADVFAGVTGAGFPIEEATYGAVVTAAKRQYSPEVANLEPLRIDAESLAAGEAYMAEVIASILADTARAAEETALAQRPWVTGYIRMIEPGACSRCAVLAGKFYLWNDGFDRHPNCRCVHVPAAENLLDDERTNPALYFESLSRAEQDKTFTTAGAEAIRLGADPTQVVNARRGMNTAQQNPRDWIPKGRLIPTDVFGKPLYITTEGVTKRGAGRKAMGTGRPVRLMPESILRLGKSPEDRIRLLKLYGYIT